MTFEGFDPDAVALLAELPTWSADRYAADKDRLARGVSGPGLALITEVADRLDADLTVAPRSSVSPLHRDLRFAAPGAPRYKDHLLLTAWEGRDKRSSPTIWLRIDAERVGFASGIGFTPEIRERWRDAIGGDAGATLVELLERLVASRDAQIAGDQVQRVPAPFAVDHPRADLLRRTGFQVRFVEPLPPDLGTREVVAWCTDRIDRLLPVHRWLVANLTKE